DPYRAFWGLSALLVCAAFLGAEISLGTGTPSARYLVGLVFATAAVVPLWAAPSPRRRTLAGAIAGVVCLLSVVALARGDLPALKDRLPVLRYGGGLVAALERQGLTRGFAGYWEAAPLTWQSAGRVLVAPVARCGRELCPSRINSISGWYTPRGTRTFLIVDSNADGFRGAAASLGRAVRSERFGALRVLVYAHDIAARLG
ncbi:MAG: hypothetical protein ACYDA3_14685, partial [Gaiellaceae bacterium]